MKIETKHKLYFEGYNDEVDFKKEVIRIILSDDKFLIFFTGRTKDLSIVKKYYIFENSKINGKTVMKNSGTKEKFSQLMEITGHPKWCVIMWKRTRCKFIKRRKS